MRFLLSRRWILFGVAVIVLAWVTTQLGQWQFHRLDNRRAQNSLLKENLAAPTVPVDTLMSTDTEPAAGDEWRLVTAHGHWDDGHTVALKYRPRGGQSGVEVVTPLVTDSGRILVVNRGWLASPNTSARPDTPPPPAGEVTVTGHVRIDATGKATNVHDGMVRSISSRTIGADLGAPAYRGYLTMASEDPVAAEPLLLPELPDDTSEGPHFFYGLQWWFFGALSIFGFGYLVFDEWRRIRRNGADVPEGTGPPEPSSEGTQEAAVDGQHGAGDEGTLRAE